MYHFSPISSSGFISSALPPEVYQVLSPSYHRAVLHLFSQTVLRPDCSGGGGGGGCKPLLDEPTDSAGTYLLDLVVLLIESRALLIPTKHTITEQFIYTYI